MRCPTPHLRLLPGSSGARRRPPLVESYRRLADVFHDVLAEQSLDALLERIADALAELVPHDSLTIYEADEAQAPARPVSARDEWADEIMPTLLRFGEGLTGWARRASRVGARRTRRTSIRAVSVVPGTPRTSPRR